MHNFSAAASVDGVRTSGSLRRLFPRSWARFPVPLLSDYAAFYEDVVDELRAICAPDGQLERFVCCCNLQPSLRGTVYLEFCTCERL